ncbi:hypothetical protein M4D58_26930, partial [Brevibacillus borstelensis]|uniref:hypothetical protein n=1 Tax=Brevibacillus borstelensis TaxID=45462 RepID=UPI00203E992D
LHDLNIFAVIGHRAFSPVKGLIAKWRFKYDPEKNVYICPQKHVCFASRKCSALQPKLPKHLPAV